MNIVIDELKINYNGFYKGYATGFIIVNNRRSYPFLYRIYSPKNGESWKLVSIENMNNVSDNEIKKIELRIKNLIPKDTFYELAIEKNSTQYSNKMIYDILNKNNIASNNIRKVSLDEKKKRIIVEMENGDSIYLMDDFNMI